MPRYDAHESGFPHYHRVVGFVREIHRRAEPERRCPPRSPAAPRRRTSTTIARWPQTLAAPLHEVADTHNYTAWRDALDPHLTRLLADAW